VRDFWRGESATLGEFASRLTGSSDLYEHSGRKPIASINFVTAHDGFTLRDLVSYNEKHNDANGEGGNDGESHNRSWNCGVEGPTDDEAVLELRARQQRNFIATLLLSQGVPMVLHGDEMGRTQGGNNNVYAQDSEIAWMDWSLAGKNAGLVGFTAGVVALRRGHPVFRRRRFFDGRPIARRRSTDGRTALPDIAWFNPSGEEMAEQDWDSGFGKCVTVFLNGQGITEPDSRGDVVTDDSFLLSLNAHYEDIEVTLPPPDYGTAWVVVVDTAVGEVTTLTTVPGVVAATPPSIDGGSTRTVPARSLLVLQRTETTRS
jgi:glycogen operon protein